MNGVTHHYLLFMWPGIDCFLPTILLTRQAGSNDNNLRNTAKSFVAMISTQPVSKTLRPPRKLVLIAFPGVQLLDVAGPADVFGMANAFSPEPAFEVVLVSASGGPIVTTSGIVLQTRALAGITADRIDTLLIAGGEKQGLVEAVQDQRLKTWVCRVAGKARRVGSVCSGAFALGQWGLLEGHRATTHWSVATLLERLHPATAVEADAIYIQDGRIWTSGGVTSGIDMCLAMVEQDLGRWVAARVAKQLILTTRRVGNQSQFSQVLHAQSGRYGELVDWMRKHLREPISVAALADMAGESERSFHRRFQHETGHTPGAFLETLRLQAAREQLEAGASVKTSARVAGYASDAQLARAFRRRFGMSPTEYRKTC